MLPSGFAETGRLEVARARRGSKPARDSLEAMRNHGRAEFLALPIRGRAQPFPYVSLWAHCRPKAGDLWDRTLRIRQPRERLPDSHER